MRPAERERAHTHGPNECGLTLHSLSNRIRHSHKVAYRQFELVKNKSLRAFALFSYFRFFFLCFMNGSIHQVGCLQFTRRGKYVYASPLTRRQLLSIYHLTLSRRASTSLTILILRIYQVCHLLGAIFIMNVSYETSCCLWTRALSLTCLQVWIDNEKSCQ